MYGPHFCISVLYSLLASPSHLIHFTCPCHPHAGLPTTRGPPHALPVSPSSRPTRPSIQTPSFRCLVLPSRHVQACLVSLGIKPMWEDEARANGGKWVSTMKNNPTLLDQCFKWLTMTLVGEELYENDEICGAIVSLRSKVNRI